MEYNRKKYDNMVNLLICGSVIFIILVTTISVNHHKEEALEKEGLLLKIERLEKELDERE